MFCPYCMDDDSVQKRGIRNNKYIKKQQYWCNKCKKYFVERDGFEYMTYPKEIILKVLQLHKEGLSLSKIRDNICHYDRFHLYDATILNWIKKYAKSPQISKKIN